ncbi:MAG: hypothetical protein ABWY16_09510 [Pedobacter sp.]|uniref:hypothetical protein n=1 Tax=Pedobacter sp. TaxID=1411316 RepID=UPI003393EF6D
MKIKLIQSGGFAGKSKFAEEDLSGHPEQLQAYLDEQLSEFQNRDSATQMSSSRDTFSYSIEYKGIRMPVSDEAVLAPELTRILTKLKSNLHY